MVIFKDVNNAKSYKNLQFFSLKSDILFQNVIKHVKENTEKLAESVIKLKRHFLQDQEAFLR